MSKPIDVETTSLDASNIEVDGRAVTELRWEDKDLHIVYADDGAEVVYKNAYFTDHKVEVDRSVVDETEFTFKAKVTLNPGGKLDG